MSPRFTRAVRVFFYVGAIAVVLIAFHQLTARVNESEARAAKADHAAEVSRTLASDNAKVGDQALTAVSQLAAQVRRLGGHPVVEPSQLPTVVSGPPGPAGLQGIMGVPGLNGNNGKDGAQGPPGPTGPTGPVGPAGADGTNGKDGKDGTNGADGAPGATGPAGYPESFTIGFGNGNSTFTCTDPDGDHNYTCATDTPTGTPTP